MLSLRKKNIVIHHMFHKDGIQKVSVTTPRSARQEKSDSKHRRLPHSPDRGEQTLRWS